MNNKDDDFQLNLLMIKEEITNFISMSKEGIKN